MSAGGVRSLPAAIGGDLRDAARIKATCARQQEGSPRPANSR